MLAGPGVTPLYTEDVPCCPEPILAASATHSVILPANEQLRVTDFIKDGQSSALRFEVRHGCVCAATVVRNAMAHCGCVVCIYDHGRASVNE